MVAFPVPVLDSLASCYLLVLALVDVEERQTLLKRLEDQQMTVLVAEYGCEVVFRSKLAVVVAAGKHKVVSVLAVGFRVVGGNDQDILCKHRSWVGQNF